MKRAQTLAATSLAVALTVLALKALAWWVTSSVALYADALESLVNVAASAAAFAAVLYANRPADTNHPYGHAKAEYFSAVFTGVLIVVAALSIIEAAWQALAEPRAIAQAPLGLAISGVATALNAIWAWVLIRRGRRLGSPALVADGRHLVADVATSLGVIIGVGLVALTGILWIDPALAAATAANILWSGWRLMRESVGGLMDESVGRASLDRIRALISGNAEGAIEAHDLRTRQAGRFTFIEFHLVVPETMPVGEAHEICDRIETALKAELDPAIITIHVEPPHKAKHRGVVVV